MAASHFMRDATVTACLGYTRLSNLLVEFAVVHNFEKQQSKRKSGSHNLVAHWDDYFIYVQL